jgi:hypothetical protein
MTRGVWVLISAFCLLESSVVADDTHPALPLPDPTPDEIAVENWPEGKPLPNSVRAWHYNLSLVKPLLEVGAAMNDPTLPFVIKRMLAAVVVSRNRCLY